MMTRTAIKNGDIFRWSYVSEKLDRDYLSYWAKSRIAVAQDGVLADTYWGSSTDNSIFQHSDVGTRIRLEFLANFEGLEKISEGEAEYYADTDIVNLNHANSPKGNCYRRAGTTRNRGVMLSNVARAIERAESEIRSAHHDLSRLQETKETLEAGAALEGVWI